MKISEKQRKCLEHLVTISDDDDHNYTFFRVIAKHTGLSQREVRIAVRALKRKGLADYSQLFDDDGMIAGSGYGATTAGVQLINVNSHDNPIIP